MRSWRRYTHYDPNAAGGGGAATLVTPTDPPAPPAGGPNGGDPATPPAPPAAGDATPPAGSAPTPPAGGAAPPPAGATPPVVPPAYDLKLPPNASIDPAALERTAATARALGLSNDAAQTALEFVNAEVASRVTAITEAARPGGAEWTKQVQGWEQQALSDAAIGGSPEQLQATADLSRRVLDKYFPPSVKEFLHNTGYGSHPDILRGLAAIGKASAEGSLVMPGSQGGGKKDPADVFYGSSTQS